MSDEILTVLRSIDSTLKAMLSLAQERTAKASGKAVATDRDLDGKYGDPELKFMPRDWTGHSFKNHHFSECPPDLLDLVAETFDYFAKVAEEKDERTDRGKPVADYKRQDAARARGWALRMRSGKHRAPVVAHGGGDPAWQEADDWR